MRRVARRTFDGLREALDRDAAAPPTAGPHVYSVAAPPGSDPLALWDALPGEFAAYWGTEEEGWGAAGEAVSYDDLEPSLAGPPDLAGWEGSQIRHLDPPAGTASPARLFVALPFEATPDDDDAWSDLVAGLVVLPRWSLASRGEESRLHLALPASPTAAVADEAARELEEIEAALEAGPRAPSRTTVRREPAGRARPDESGARRDWDEAVGRALAEIRGGTLEKVVLARARDVTVASGIDASAVLRGLRVDGSGRFRFGVRRGGRAFVGASPERLFENRAGIVEIEALAGTYDIGESDSGPGLVRAAEHLFASGKDLGEHALVVRGILDALEPLATSLEAGPWPDVRAARGLAHLSTGVRAELRAGVGPLDLIRALHPTPAVGGLPRRAAMALIDRLETRPRGLYAGPIGWMEPGGDACFAVGIRSALLQQDGRATVFAGAGIVAASDAAGEWAETEAKLRWFEQLVDSLVA